MRKPAAWLAVMGAAGVCLVLLLSLWVSFSGPGRLVTGGATPNPGVPSSVETETSPPVVTQTPQPNGGTSSGPARLPSWISELLTVAVLVALGYVLWRLLPRLVELVSRERALAEEAVEIQPPTDAELAERIVSAQDDHLERLAEGTPRNGIVQCWMALEATVGELGLPPLVTETSTEFLVRMLHELDVDPRTAARLAGLYHVARFSTHPLTESDRGAARQALLDLNAELGVKRVRIDPQVTEVER